MRNIQSHSTNIGKNQLFSDVSLGGIGAHKLREQPCDGYAFLARHGEKRIPGWLLLHFFAKNVDSHAMSVTTPLDMLKVLFSFHNNQACTSTQSPKMLCCDSKHENGSVHE